MLVNRPANLPAALETRFASLTERLSCLGLDLPPPLGDSLGHVTLVSEFVASVLLREPAALARRVADPARLSIEDIASRLGLTGLDEASAMARLRRVRAVELARIAWRDLAGWDDLPATLGDLSVLADAMIGSAYRYARDRLEPRYGRPRDGAGTDAEMLVLAMGKLGGRELNFSSDVDLVFLAPDEVVFEGHDGVEAETYYVRLAQLLIKLLDQQTEEGFAFRVDTRLRPFGQSGPLVIGMSAFESYLVTSGRDWERYGYQKARLITGLAYEAELFGEILTPFVYRRYLDFGMFEAMRAMKRMIRTEVARKDMADNIKLGPGGIREIEFIVQVFQLVRGGQDPKFRSSSLLATLPLLADPKQLGAESTRKLEEAYVFLRRLENRLQAMNDRQVHRLPADEESRARLALAMGFASWEELGARIDAERAAVEAQFDDVAREPREAGSERPESQRFADAWESGNVASGLAGTPLAGNDAAIALLQQLRDGGLYARTDELSRRRLVAVLSSALPLLFDHPDAALALERILPIFQAICRRSAYLALLDENPGALANLLALTNRSGLLARELAEHPVLLDELLDPRVFDTPPSRSELLQMLEQQLASVAPGDVEASLDAMRNFKSAAVFRVAVADTLGQLALMKVSDRLTDTAEIVLELALDLAERELLGRYGRPMCGEEGKLREAGFAIVAYGKLAGLELGYGSDLDLVFLHDSSGEHQTTDGDSATDNSVYFARLAQRLIHFLSIQTTAGRLYEVDTRLRPSGQSGMLVTSIENFGRYQRKEAWVWEHQALLRSRAVAGSARVCGNFEAERRQILMTAVDRENLKSSVLEMRRRMRDELSKSQAGQFDIKQDEGGLADIEFLVDYLVLAHCATRPALIEFPDNVRQLEALERARIVSTGRAAELKECYLALRQRAHDLALDAAGRVVDEAELADVRASVVHAWTEVFD